MSILKSKKAIVAAFGLGLSMLSTSIAAQSSLKIGTDLTYPPYNYLEGKVASGFDAEFMRLVSNELNKEPTFLDTRFANLIMGVNLGKFDVIASTLYVTPERAKEIDYIPYMKTGGLLLASKTGAFKPSKPSDLCGKRVSSIQGAAWIKKLHAVSKSECEPNNLGKIDVREFPTSPEASQALIAGMVDAQFEDAAVAKVAATKSGKLELTSDIIYPVVVGLAVKKGQDDFKSEVAAAVKSVEQTPEFLALLEKYSVSAPSEQEFEAALNGTL
ncbi:ABC transporter substrate-binding protein [Vibrio mytili]|uniref:ABC transporter substrate-binding protein n=1 Tax=Vibrio mytili TaxID=50718 RepID=UPI003C6F0F8D